MRYEFPAIHLALFNAGWRKMVLGQGSKRRFYHADFNHVHILADTYNSRLQYIDTRTGRAHPDLKAVIAQRWELRDFIDACPKPNTTLRPCGARVKRWILT